MRNCTNNGVMVNAAILHPNQVEVFFGDQSGRIRIWDLTTNSVRDFFEDSENIGIRSLVMASDASKLVAGNSAGFCYIWSSTNGDDFTPQQELEAHPDNYVLRVQLTPDNQFLATASSDRSCKIWQLNEEEDEF